MHNTRDVLPIPSEIICDPRKLKAVELLGNGARLEMSWEEIAEEAGVSVRSLYTWRRDPAFQEAVTVIMQETLKERIPGVFKKLWGATKDGDLKEAIRAGELLLKAGGVLIDRVAVDTGGEAQAMLNDLDQELEGIKHQAIEGDVEEAEYEEVHPAE